MDLSDVIFIIVALISWYVQMIDSKIDTKNFYFPRKIKRGFWTVSDQLYQLGGADSLAKM